LNTIAEETTDLMVSEMLETVPQEKRPRLTIVVLSYGAGEEVSGLLSELSGAESSVANEVIVVHNPRHHGDILTLSDPRRVRIVEMKTNGGYVGGMNVGIEIALRDNPEYVLLLTHDVRISTRGIEELCATLIGPDDVGVVGPVLCSSDGQPYSAGMISRGRVRVRHRSIAEGMPSPLWPCAAVDGSVMMWRASALQELHGFDKRFFMYFEDVDICTRAARLGWRVGVATDVRALSAPGKSSRRTAHAYLQARNGLAFAQSFGAVGLLRGFARSAYGLWQATPKPGGKRIRDGEARQAAAQYWKGTLLGILDFCRGRWGAPPSYVLRDSDIATD
jgi:N-acetylglucosaminyl-diphospho-decaprenol L-rhamnosyltransferase